MLFACNCWAAPGPNHRSDPRHAAGAGQNEASLIGTRKVGALFIHSGSHAEHRIRLIGQGHKAKASFFSNSRCHAAGRERPRRRLDRKAGAHMSSCLLRCREPQPPFPSRHLSVPEDQPLLLLDRLLDVLVGDIGPVVISLGQWRGRQCRRRQQEVSCFISNPVQLSSGRRRRVSAFLGDRKAKDSPCGHERENC